MPAVAIVIVVIAAVAAAGFFFTRTSEVTEAPAPAAVEVPPETESPVDTPTVSSEEEPIRELEELPEDFVPELIQTEPVSTNTYADGTFSGESSYSTGRSIHELVVSITLANDIVTGVDIEYDGAGAPGTPSLRSFDNAYEPEVLGKDLDNVQLSRVGGASWTSDAFNEALDTIKQNAAS